MKLSFVACVVAVSSFVGAVAKEEQLGGGSPKSIALTEDHSYWERVLQNTEMSQAPSPRPPSGQPPSGPAPTNPPPPPAPTNPPPPAPTNPPPPAPTPGAGPEPTEAPPTGEPPSAASPPTPRDPLGDPGDGDLCSESIQAIVNCVAEQCPEETLAGECPVIEGADTCAEVELICQAVSACCDNACASQIEAVIDNCVPGEVCEDISCATGGRVDTTCSCEACPESSIVDPSKIVTAMTRTATCAEWAMMGCTLVAEDECIPFQVEISECCVSRRNLRS